ncbi:MAG TPA: ATP-binding protein, partial [Acidimicrobiales bacterium]
RRNAESLLVLAGIEPPRQWAAPVRLTDVIRAALGEVESYQRVRVRDTDPATVIGSAAADLAHLLAELIENALVFSPPDQSVEIRGRHRSDGGYTLAVIDSGLGMAEVDIAAANRRLAGVESFTIAPSKYLGHYVAGNLAARHGIGVRLDNSPGNGVTATILVPPALLTDEAVTSAPITPPGGHRLPATARHAVPPAPVLPASAPAGGRQPAAPSPPAPLWPPAPAPAAPAAHLDRRGPAPDGIAVPPVRPGGLARRVPAAPAAPAAPRRGPAPADDQALLSALGRYAPGTGPTGGGPARHSGATPAAGGAAGRDPLARRVKGAQLPHTSVLPLHNGYGGTGSAGTGRAGRQTPASARRPSAQSFDRATDVQRLLTSFTIGVQRGLAEARRSVR